MKKRILVAAACLLLATLTLLLLLPSGDPVETTPPTTRPTDGPDRPIITWPSDTGAVRLYTCDHATAAILTALAAEYQALTGVTVEVLRPEADGCQATLERLMAGENPPTMFCVHSQSQLNHWQPTLLDLTDTDLAAQLVNEGLGFRVNGKLLAIPIGIDAYGLLVNSDVLALKGAYSRGEIKSLTDLGIVAQILKNNSTSAFPTAALTARDAGCLLLGSDLKSVRAFLDLYIANCAKKGDPVEQFQDGKTPFFLGGSWDHDRLVDETGHSLQAQNLDILPTFASGAMEYVCSTAWCVNAGANQPDVQHTLVFLKWMVTASENTAAHIDRLQVLTPFRGAAWHGNSLQNKLRTYMKTEPAILRWASIDGADKDLLQVLGVYMNENTDENWELVCRRVSEVKAQLGYPSE